MLGMRSRLPAMAARGDIDHGVDVGPRALLEDCFEQSERVLRAVETAFLRLGTGQPDRRVRVAEHGDELRLPRARGRGIVAGVWHELRQGVASPQVALLGGDDGTDDRAVADELAGGRRFA